MAWFSRRFPRRDSRQALAAAGGHLDGRGALIGGEAVPAGEPGHVLDVADHGRGDDRADPGQAGQAGASGLHRGGERLPGRAQLRVDAAQVLKERGGELAAGRIHRPRGHDRAQQPGGGRRGDRLGDPAAHNGLWRSKRIIQKKSA